MFVTYPDRRFLSAYTARTNYRDKDGCTALYCSVLAQHAHREVQRNACSAQHAQAT